MIDFLLQIPLQTKITSLVELFIKKPDFARQHVNEEHEYIFWGDPILDNCFMKSLDCNSDIKFIINNVKGHFFFIAWNKQKKFEVTVGNSFFSVLPIYYWIGQDMILLSENALVIGERIGKKALSRRFILETTLFNYPLFNQSAIDGVNLLPSNSTISVAAGKCRIEKHTRIGDYFDLKPRPWRKTVDEMSDLFLQIVEKYLPDQQYASSLTGGFDGRTLVSAGLYYKKQFCCYSFGSTCSRDIEIASRLALAAKIPFIYVVLDEEFVRNSSLQDGLDIIRGASGTATFARAHYVHAAKLLSARAEHIVTGNFGSEIFRAAHVPGVVISRNLYHLFNSRTLGDALCAIETSSETDYLNRKAYEKEWLELKENLSRLPCYNSEYRTFSKNQQFYVFVFEEILRKYFGAEMVNQFHYIKNRTPFLDWDFVRAILQTGLAGVHSDFFEHNPIKRFKGQVLYSHIIRKAYPHYGEIETDKGYRPKDLLSIGGKLRITRGYFKKVLNKKEMIHFDPYAVSAAFNMNRRYFSQIRIDKEIFNVDRIRRELRDDRPDEALFKPLSLAYLKELVES